jgi:hypothetical protein
MLTKHTTDAPRIPLSPAMTFCLMTGAEPTARLRGWVALAHAGLYGQPSVEAVWLQHRAAIVAEAGRVWLRAVCADRSDAARGWLPALARGVSRHACRLTWPCLFPVAIAAMQGLAVAVARNSQHCAPGSRC